MPHYLQTLFSTVHALYISLMSSIFLIGYDIDYSHCMKWSLLYFIIDGSYILYYSPRYKYQMLTHHMAGCGALLPNILNTTIVSPLYYNLVAQGMLSEYSTVTLNICWYLNDRKQTDNIVYKVSGILTLLLYIPFRLISFPHILIKLILNNYIILASLDASVIGLNYYWFYKLVKRVLP